MESQASSSPDRQQTRWLMQLRRHGGMPLVLAFGAPLVSGALLVMQVRILSDLLGGMPHRGDWQQALTPFAASIAGILALRAVLLFIGERAGSLAAERIIARLRTALFAHLLRQRPDWASARASGAFSATIVDQVDALEQFFARFLPAMVQAAVLPLAFAAVVLPVDWIAGLLLLATAPLIPLFMALVGWGAEAAKNAEATAFTRLSSHFADRLRGLLTLKLFGREQVEIVMVQDASERLRESTMRVLRIAFLSSAALEFFAALGVAGVALYVGLTYLGMLDLRGTPLTLQAGLFCLMIAPEVYAPLRLLAAHYHDRAGAKAAVAAIAIQFDGLVEIPAPSQSERRTRQPLIAPALTVSATRLSLAAPGTSTIVLDKADLHIRPGERVALVGESGCGKSTLLEALAGLRNFDGEISLSHRPLADWPEATLRSAVAFLGQRPRIFAGTIAENIRLGRSNATDDEVRAAAGLACLSEVISALPQGINTLIGDDGTGLSGGEAHRVALARIYLRQPSLILLDEPTAHLDRATETGVIDNLLAFAAGRTLVVATHSQVLADRMDRTLRVAAGAIHPVPSRQARQPERIVA